MILVQRQKYSKGIKANGLLDVSGSRLAEALGIKVFTPRIKCRNSRRLVINYGCSSIPWLGLNQQVINKPEAIYKACNKIETFYSLGDANIPIPQWCSNMEVASFWFSDTTLTTKPIVFCRTLLSGSKGKGIVIARKPEELVNAPLYTLYIPKASEYRVHVAFGNAIHIQKKKKLTTEELVVRGITNREPLVRNSSNGYVFSSNIDETEQNIESLCNYAIQSVNALGLDFGAVDLIVGKYGGVYVLEINTAPGIEGITLDKYVEAINNKFN